MISGEPRKDTVFYKSFIWSQWDAQGQRLHLVCFRKTDKTAYGGKIYKPILLSYQFNEDTQACFMVNLYKSDMTLNDTVASFINL